VSIAGGLETPPELAVIMTVPAETPVATPLLSIVAMLEALHDHWMGAPLIGLPDESSACAVN
jgi:hypothetical protein